MRKQTKVIVVALLLGALGWTLGLRTNSPTDEDRIRIAVETVAAGVETADIARAMQPVSDAYSDPEGLDRKGIYGMLWSQFRKRGPIGVWMSAIDVQLNGDTATARFDAALFEGEEGTTIGLPVSADLLTFEVNLRRDEGDWRIVSHTRAPALELSETAP